MGATCLCIALGAAAPPLCPHGCICPTLTTVICNGLELKMVPLSSNANAEVVDLTNAKTVDFINGKAVDLKNTNPVDLTSAKAVDLTHKAVNLSSAKVDRLKSRKVDVPMRPTFQELIEQYQSYVASNKLLGTKTVGDTQSLLHTNNIKPATKVTHQIHCDCQLADHFGNNFNNINELICNSPPSLYGKSVSAAWQLLGCPKSREKRQGGWPPPRPPEPCTPNPCLNQGTCFDDGWSRHCTCPQGYTGEICEISGEISTSEHMDSCAIIPCLNHGTCIDIRYGEIRCLCLPGFTGHYCETRITISSACNSNTCLNGGTCVDNGTGILSCMCAQGYTGRNCETLELCGSTLCLNQGICIVDNHGGYTCVCSPEYTGYDCATPIDLLCDSSSYCLNGGTCMINRTRNFYCLCPPGYSGAYCEVIQQVCASAPCLNHGTCLDDGYGNYRCACLPEYKGRRCEFLTADPCSSAPCLNGGTCSIDNVNRGYKCTCLQEYGYQGKNCEVQFKVKIARATNVSISVSWELLNGLETRAFEVTWRSQNQRHTEMYMFQSEVVSGHDRMYTIQRLRPMTGYEICVRAQFNSKAPSLKQCVESGTYPSDAFPKHEAPLGPSQGDRIEQTEGNESNLHKYGILVFGIAIAICAVAIIVVAVLYHKRVQSLRNTSTSSSPTPPSTQTSSNGDINDIQLQIAVPDTIPIIRVTDTDTNHQRQSPVTPTTPPSDLPPPAYEEVAGISGQNGSSPQSQSNGVQHHQIDIDMDSSEMKDESNL